MGEAYNVFISWSGERSQMAAEALRKWLPIVLPASKPWMSKEDIQKGSRGLEEVAKALDGMRIGIVCLTPENLDAHWILYEAGALAKTLGEKARVCTFLLGGLNNQEITPPLGLFQWTKADDMKDIGKLIHDINKALDPPSEAEDTLDTRFGAVWPILEKKLSAIPVASAVAKPTREVPEMVAEILELSRTSVDSRKVVERLDRYLPFLERLALGNLPRFTGRVGGTDPGFLAPLSSLAAPLSDDASALIKKIVTADAGRQADLERAQAELKRSEAVLKAASEEAEHHLRSRFEQKVEAKKKQRDQGK